MSKRNFRLVTKRHVAFRAFVAVATTGAMFAFSGCTFSIGTGRSGSPSASPSMVTASPSKATAEPTATATADPEITLEPTDQSDSEAATDSTIVKIPGADATVTLPEGWTQTTRAGQFVVISPTPHSGFKANVTISVKPAGDAQLSDVTDSLKDQMAAMADVKVDPAGEQDATIAGLPAITLDLVNSSQQGMEIQQRINAVILHNGADPVFAVLTQSAASGDVDGGHQAHQLLESLSETADL